MGWDLVEATVASNLENPDDNATRGLSVLWDIVAFVESC